MSFKTINPYSEMEIQTYEFDSPASVEKKMVVAVEGFQVWKNLNIEQRVEKVLQFKELLLNNSESLAEMATIEMGKPYTESVAEVRKCLAMIDYYCDHAKTFLADQKISSTYKESFITYQAQGCILGIMPWNFPYWQVLRFAIPTILAGNTVLLKHAPNVQGCQDLLQGLFGQTSIPEGVFSTIKVDIDQIEKIIADDRIRGVSFTGSERAGREVGSLAGKYLKKCILELGGSDAYIVLEDADVKLAAKACVSARFINNGQSCVAAKRWIVDKKVMTEFLDEAKKNIEQLKVGDPLLNDTTIGPMARKDLKRELVEQVKRSLEMGAKLFYGNESSLESEGCVLTPLILKDVVVGQPAFEEELFGPVGVIITAESTEDAIRLANISRFGLGGALFSKNLDKAKKIATSLLDTGGVFINDFYKSTPELPFGGVKASGIGRELSHLALYEFANIKTVVVN